MKIAFLGGGNMASAILAGIHRQGWAQEGDLMVSDPHEENRDRLFREVGAQGHESVGAWLKAADVVVLAVKPQKLKACVQVALPWIRSDAVVLSIAAGVPSSSIASWLNGQSIIRAMPNTPARVGLGMTGMFASKEVPQEAKDACDRIMQSVGKVIWVNEEEAIHTITGGPGSGPAYVFLFMESLAQALKAQGVNEQDARELSLATVEGAAALARQTGEPFAQLREKVTSKGGTTAQALAVFEARDLRGITQEAVQACIDRSKELSALFG